MAVLRLPINAATGQQAAAAGPRAAASTNCTSPPPAASPSRAAPASRVPPAATRTAEMNRATRLDAAYARVFTAKDPALEPEARLGGPAGLDLTASQWRLGAADGVALSGNRGAISLRTVLPGLLGSAHLALFSNLSANGISFDQALGSLWGRPLRLGLDLFGGPGLAGVGFSTTWLMAPAVSLGAGLGLFRSATSALHVAALEDDGRVRLSLRQGSFQGFSFDPKILLFWCALGGKASRSSAWDLVYDALRPAATARRLARQEAQSQRRWQVQIGRYLGLAQPSLDTPCLADPLALTGATPALGEGERLSVYRGTHETLAAGAGLGFWRGSLVHLDAQGLELSVQRLAGHRLTVAVSQRRSLGASLGAEVPVAGEVHRVTATAELTTCLLEYDLSAAPARAHYRALIADPLPTLTALGRLPGPKGPTLRGLADSWQRLVAAAPPGVTPQRVEWTREPHRDDGGMLGRLPLGPLRQQLARSFHNSTDQRDTWAVDAQGSRHIAHGSHTSLQQGLGRGELQAQAHCIENTELSHDGVEHRSIWLQVERAVHGGIGARQAFLQLLQRPLDLAPSTVPLLPGERRLGLSYGLEIQARHLRALAELAPTAAGPLATLGRRLAATAAPAGSLGAAQAASLSDWVLEHGADGVDLALAALHLNLATLAPQVAPTWQVPEAGRVADLVLRAGRAGGTPSLRYEALQLARGLRQAKRQLGANPLVQGLGQDGARRPTAQLRTDALLLREAMRAARRGRD